MKTARQTLEACLPQQNSHKTPQTWEKNCPLVPRILAD